MSMDTFVAIVSIVCFVVCYAGYRYSIENVKLTYKDQKVGVKKA